MRHLAFTSILAVIFATAAQAHAHLEKSTPVDGSTVGQSPPEIMLHFSEAARLTSLTIQKDGAAKRKLEQLPAKPAAMLTVPLPALEPGRYTVSYRVVSDDNHIMGSDLHFTVSPVTAPASKGPGASATDSKH